MVYFNNLLNLLGRWHCPSTIIWMFCTIAAFCVDDLVAIVSFLLLDFLDSFSAYCNTFTARTDLSSLSPARMFDTSLYGSLGPIPGCLLRVHLFRVLLLTSLPTASLTPVLRSSAAIGFMFRALGTRCRLLRLARATRARWLVLA